MPVVAACCRPMSIHRWIRVLSARRRCTVPPCAGSGRPRAAARRSPARARRIWPGGRLVQPKPRPARRSPRHSPGRRAARRGVLGRDPSDPPVHETIRARAGHPCRVERPFDSGQATVDSHLPGAGLPVGMVRPAARAVSRRRFGATGAPGIRQSRAWRASWTADRMAPPARPSKAPTTNVLLLSVAWRA